MKTLILGDIHGRHIWREIINKEDPDKVIFMGDYFDSFNIRGLEQLHNFKEIVHFKENTDKDVVMLIGNHDHHYLNVGETYSGYQPTMQFDFNQVLNENLNHLQIAEIQDELLLTHAGVSPVWLDYIFNEILDTNWSKNTIKKDLNELYNNKPRLFNFSHLAFNPTGDSVEQGPLWIRPRSLLASNKGDNGLKSKFIQVVGHTEVNDIFTSFKGSKKAMGGRYYLVDALSSGGYVIYENGELIPMQLN